MKCSKVKYYTEESAKTSLKKIKKDRKKLFGHTFRRENRYYQCDSCKFWHLTTRTQQENEFLIKKIKDQIKKYKIKQERKFLKLIKEKNKQKVKP